jgi:D-alanyl-D-alanine carboxypeptidase-like protein
MASSQNGWPVVAKSACDQGPFEGVTFPNGILAGDVATIARWQLRRYEALVEPLKQGSCWGWFVKKIIGSDDYSNHSSATAWDINADEHFLGDPPSKSFTAHQIAGCRQIVDEADGVLRWGGDYSGRKDGMHWEIIGSRATVAAFAARIRRGDAPGEEEHVDQAGANLIVDTLLNRSIPFPYDPDNPTRTVKTLLGYGGASISNIANQVDTVLAPRLAVISSALANVAEQVGHPVDLSDQDTAQIVSGLLAGLPAELAQDIAKAAVDEAARRLAEGSQA